MTSSELYAFIYIPHNPYATIDVYANMTTKNNLFNFLCQIVEKDTYLYGVLRKKH